ncbi:MAG: hypothetical protein ACSHXB_00660 [Sulfitobacter sp.]
MRAIVHIVMGLSLAVPASAMTPVPICAGTPMQGQFAVWDASNVENGFVKYVGEHETAGKALVVLEHCKTGKTLIADAVVNDDDQAANHVDNVRDALDDFIYTSTPHTMKQIRAGLRTRGISSKIRTLKAESCGCSVYYPELRGNRTPYK